MGKQRDFDIVWGLKEPLRYDYTKTLMRDALLRRLLRTEKKSLRPYRYAAMYGASWRIICNRSKR